MADMAIVIGATAEEVAARVQALGATAKAADIHSFSSLTTVYQGYTPAGDIEAASPGFIWTGAIS